MAKRIQREPDPRASAIGSILFGLVVASMGAIPMLSALNVIPTPDSAFGAPRLLVALLVSPFLLFGLMIMAQAIPPLLGTRALPDLQGILGPVIALVFLTSATGFLLWLVVSGEASSGRSSLTLGPLSLVLPEAVGAFLARGFVSLCAGLMTLLSLVVWFNVLREGTRRIRSVARGR